jgi:hypothetical protein
MGKGEKKNKKERKKAFKEIKRELTNNPALGLSDVMKPFFLYVHERLVTAVRVLTQLLGSCHHHLVAYLSKQHDAVSQSWLPCLCALATTAILVAKANLLWDKNSQSKFPTVLILIEYKGNYWLTNSQMVRYQSMICENPHVRLKVVKTLNPAP